MLCPFCGAVAEVPTVDIGAGVQQCGPAECPRCHASQDFDGVWRSAEYWTGGTDDEGDNE